MGSSPTASAKNMNEIIGDIKETQKNLGSIELWRGIYGGNDSGGYANGISSQEAREKGVTNVNNSRQQLGLVNRRRDRTFIPDDFIVPKHDVDEEDPENRSFFGLQVYFDRASAEGWIKDRKYRDNPPLLVKLTIPIHLLDINNPNAISFVSKNYTASGKSSLLTVEDLSKIKKSTKKETAECSLIDPRGVDIDLAKLKPFETLYVPEFFEPWSQLENLEFIEMTT